jgi:hypothetical protein
MTKSEAEERARTMQREHPDRDTHRFIPRQSAEGGWEVAKLPVPEQLRRPKLTPTVEAAPKPSPAEDPRSGHERRAPGIPGGLS